MDERLLEHLRHTDKLHLQKSFFRQTINTTKHINTKNAGEFLSGIFYFIIFISIFKLSKLAFNQQFLFVRSLAISYNLRFDIRSDAVNVVWVCPRSALNAVVNSVLSTSSTDPS